mgnify:FL=1
MGTSFQAVGEIYDSTPTNPSPLSEASFSLAALLKTLVARSNQYVPAKFPWPPQRRTWSAVAYAYRKASYLPLISAATVERCQLCLLFVRWPSAFKKSAACTCVISHC